MNNNIPLGKDDYIEPSCPFCTEAYEKKAPVRPVPLTRIIEKADKYLNRNDYDGAERILKYWLSESENGRDRRGELSIRNELMGLFRKQGKKREAEENAIKAAAMISELKLDNTVTAGTTYVNAATVFKAFGSFEKALLFYEKARTIYENELSVDDSRLGGLYNNMALALVDAKRFEEAECCYQKALSVMRRVENGELESAITYLNMANAEEAKNGLIESAEIIDNYISYAIEMLDANTLPRNGYYAFVCEKCAPTFEYYGYFSFAEELKKRAGRIYEGT